VQDEASTRAQEGAANGGVRFAAAELARLHASFAQDEAHILRARSTRTIERARELMRESQVLRARLAHGREAVFAAAADWSAMRLLGGGSVDEGDGPQLTGFDSFVHPEDQSRVWAAIQDGLRRISVVELQHRLRWPDGNVSWVYSRAVPLVAENGDITEWLGAVSEMAAPA
jgi:PAS fold